MSNDRQKKVVVVIHGFFAHKLLLLPIAWHLRRAGFKVKLFGYASTLFSIERHAEKFRKLLDRLNADASCEELNIVSHSMEGIVTRQAMLDSVPEKLKRIVMFAPPNEGSPVARFLSTFVVPFCKTLRQISDQDDSFVNLLGEPNTLAQKEVQIGIVAGSYDWVIPSGNALLTCAADEVTIFSGHNGLLVRPKASKMAVRFLISGTFSDRDGYSRQQDSISNE